jgi:hypothetical protein
MLSDPDNLRLQLVNTTHGLFDTIMPGGRVTPKPAALIPIGLDHIILSVTDVDRALAMKCPPKCTNLAADRLSHYPSSV